MLNQDWLLTSNVLHSGPKRCSWVSVSSLLTYIQTLASYMKGCSRDTNMWHLHEIKVWIKRSCPVTWTWLAGWQHCTFWQITAAIWHVGEFNDLLDQMAIVLWLFGCLYSLGQFLVHLNDTYIPIHGPLCFTTCFLSSNFTGNHFPISAGTIAHD